MNIEQGMANVEVLHHSMFLVRYSMFDWGSQSLYST